MSSYYDDEDDLDIHVRRQAQSPRPVRYVQPPSQIRTYYGVPTGPSYLAPEQHTTLITRARSQSRDRRPSPPLVAPPQPVIINNRIYNELSSDEDNSDDSNHRSHRKRTSHRRRSSRRKSRSRSRSRTSSRSDSHSRSRSRSRPSRLTKADWEAEQTRRELNNMRLVKEREEDERRLAKEYQDQAELRQAKRELDKIRQQEAVQDEEKRIKKEVELRRLKDEEAAASEQRERNKQAQAAVEKYKKEELERLELEKKRKEENEKEYKRRLQEDLLHSGLDEKAIAAILGKQKIPDRTPEKITEKPEPLAHERPTYTRMARKYLSIETLRTFRIEYDVDPDPDYVLIKRWIPEWEQDQFWQHTKYIREKRGKTLMVEEKKHHSREPEFEWVRKKSDRHRSKSPALLRYLAGGRPS